MEQTTAHGAESSENDYTSFSLTADTTVLFHDIVFAFLSLKLVFFGKSFFFFFFNVGLEL